MEMFKVWGTNPHPQADGLDQPVHPGLLQLWAPELFEDVPPPEMPLVSAAWLWAALSNDPKTALAEMVAAKSDTWLTWGFLQMGVPSWMVFVREHPI